MDTHNDIIVSTYSRSKKSKILFMIITIPIIAVMIWAVYDALTSVIEGNDSIIILVGGILLIIGFLYFIRRITGKYIIEIHNDKIVSKVLSETEELYINDIRGYKIDTDNGVRLHLISKDEPERIFKVSMEVLENAHEILQWAELNFTNLDKLEHDEEIERIESDPGLGRTQDERIQKLEKAKKLGRVLNGAAIILTIYTIAYPHPYEILLLFMLGFPFYILWFLRYIHEFEKYDVEVRDIFMNVFTAVTFPCLAVAIRALIDWDVLSFWDLPLPLIITSAAVFILYYVGFSEENRKWKNAGIFIIPFLAYGLGAVYIINGIFIEESPAEYEAVIIEKSTGSKGNYYFDVDSIAQYKNPDKFKVSEEIFNNYEEGDRYPIKIQTGRLGIPWIVKE